MKNGNFAVIIPDRNDRPELLEHCKMQLKRQTLQPAETFIINEESKRFPDLVWRIKKGIEICRQSEIPYAMIMENDDYYPDEYLENMYNPEYDFVGIGTTIYYHLFNRGILRMTHGYEFRSSLFCTGFRIGALDNFVWPANKEVFLDLHLWKYADLNNLLRVFLYQFNPGILPDFIPIGIKHNFGLVGGNGHNPNYPYPEHDTEDYSWLKKHVRKESFDFYMDLITQNKSNE